MSVKVDLLYDFNEFLDSNVFWTTNII